MGTTGELGDLRAQDASASRGIAQHSCSGSSTAGGEMGHGRVHANHGMTAGNSFQGVAPVMHWLAAASGADGHQSHQFAG